MILHICEAILWRRIVGNQERLYESPRHKIPLDKRGPPERDTLPLDRCFQHRGVVAEARPTRRIDTRAMSCIEPEAPVAPILIVKKCVISQISYRSKRGSSLGSKRGSSLEQFGTADGNQVLGKQVPASQSGISTKTVTYDDINIVFGEVSKFLGCGNPHLDMRMQLLKLSQARNKPLYRECGQDTDSQDCSPAIAAGQTLRNF